MLYHCRSCSNSLVIGAAYCASCGSIFPKPVPVDAGQRDAYQPHAQAPWPPRPDSALDKMGGAAIARIRKIPPGLQFAVCFAGLSLVVWYSWKDFHRPRHVTAPILTMSVSGASDVADADDSSLGSSILRRLARSVAQHLDIHEAPEAPPSSDEAASTSEAVSQVAASASASRGTLVASVAPDPIARNAAGRLTPQQQAQVAAELAALSGKHAAKAAHGVAAGQVLDTRRGVGGHSGSGGDTVPDHAVVEPAEIDTSKWGAGSSSPTPAASNSDAPLETEQQALRPYAPTQQASTSPSDAPAPGDAASHPWQSRGADRAIKPEASSRALIRLRHIYLGARTHFQRYCSAARDPREVSRLRYMLSQAAMVYPRLRPEEREEWQQDITTIAVWHVLAQSLRESIKTA